MNYHYQQFDPSACNFPPPRVPVLPRLSRQSLGTDRSESFHPVWPDQGVRHFVRARYALRQAYELAGLGEHSGLLAPSYHCRTMVDPAIRLGAPLNFFPLRADLSPDLAAIKTALQNKERPIKALLLPHYFGFAQAIGDLAELCKAHGVTLIEDCSHALFDIQAVQTSSALESRIGSTGHYVVASPSKFYPCEDGGLLWANRASDLPPEQSHALSIAQNAKAAARAAASWLRPEPACPDPAVLSLELEQIRLQANPEGLDHLISEASPSINYRPAQERMLGLQVSRWLIKHTHIERLAKQRRLNYQHWVQAMSGVPGCKPLFAELPEYCVPYMFALLIDKPAEHFSTLKRLGVPVWRWDDMAASTCPTAQAYRLKLLHLPCHQELGPEQMKWLIEAVTSVMTQRPNKAAP